MSGVGLLRSYGGHRLRISPLCRWVAEPLAGWKRSSPALETAFGRKQEEKRWFSMVWWPKERVVLFRLGSPVSLYSKY